MNSIERSLDNDTKLALKTIMIGLGVGTVLKDTARIVIPFEKIEEVCSQEISEAVCALLSNDSGPNILQAFAYTLVFLAAKDLYFRKNNPTAIQYALSTMGVAAFVSIQILLSESRPLFIGGEVNASDIWAEMLGMMGGVIFYLSQISTHLNQSNASD